MQPYRFLLTWTCAALALAITACRTVDGRTSAVTHDEPCRGLRFDLDAPDARCLVPHDRLASPDFAALAIRLREAPARVRSGETATFTLDLENASTVPLDVPVPEGCLVWETVASNARASSFESECGGLCGSGPTMTRVTLEPGGLLTKKIDFAATRMQVVGEECETRDGGPLPPGDYTLSITLPWTMPAPIPGNARARDHHHFETPLRVEAR